MDEAPDWGIYRRFPTAPLRERLHLEARDYMTVEVSPQKRASRWSALTLYGEEAITLTIRTGLPVMWRQRDIPQRFLRYIYRPYLTEFTIDEICCRAGFHPNEVYPDWGVPTDRMIELVA